MRKYEFDYHYFDEIDTSEKAYWLGFLYGDGFILSLHYGVGCGLRKEDKEHLVKCLKALGCSSLGCLRHRKDTDGWEFNLHSEHFYNRLVELGFSPNKTYVQSREIFDNVPDRLKEDFLRGLWDANGWIGVDKKGRNIAGFVCNNTLLVQAISEYTNEIMGSGFCKVLLQDGFPRLHFYSIKAKKVCDWLYKNKIPVLERKHKKYLQLRGSVWEDGEYHRIRQTQSGRYYTSIWHNGKAETIGTFDTVKEAVENYNRKAKEYGMPTQKYLGEYLKKEENMKTISLAMKWLPSINASSKETKELGRWFAGQFGLSEKGYRTMLSKGRKKIHLLEQDMSAKKWGEIEYDKVPSQAHRKHVKAFVRNDETRYKEYLDEVKNGGKKLNTSTVTTSEVIANVRSLSVKELDNTEETAVNTIWDSLDDVIPKDLNGIVVADVSGSMYSGKPRPIDISVSLALYFAERNKGVFANKFLTFSENPRLAEVRGETLTQKLDNIETAEWGMNTNIERTLDCLLQAAVASGDTENIPKVIYIISDMEFDYCATGASDTAFENARRKWNEKGLELPTVVFWNVQSRGNNLPATKFDKNVVLISGSNQNAFRFAFEGKTPEDLMLEVVNSDRYKQIVV